MLKKPFSFVAVTSGQTVFGPINIASEVVVDVAINGISQDQVGGDFAIGDIYLTLTTGVTIGTRIAGVLLI